MFFLFQAVFLAFYATKENISRLILLAFGLGLLTDLILGGYLGFTSIFNLCYVGVVSIFKTRFAYNWRWAVLFVILSQIIWLYVWRFYL